MVIVNVCKMCLKGTKLKWQNFISLSCGILVLLRKSPRREGNPGIDRVKLEKRKCQVLLSTILNSWKYIKLVINLIHNSYRESSLIHKVLFQILLILRKDGKLIPGNERVVFLHSKSKFVKKI